MAKEQRKRPRILGGVLSFISGILYILSLPAVRNYIWGQIVGKSRDKVIDVKAHIVEEEEKKRRGLFR